MGPPPRAALLALLLHDAETVPPLFKLVDRICVAGVDHLGLGLALGHPLTGDLVRLILLCSFICFLQGHSQSLILTIPHFLLPFVAALVLPADTVPAQTVRNDVLFAFTVVESQRPP